MSCNRGICHIPHHEPNYCGNSCIIRVDREVVDNLESTSAKDVLSSNQGRVLKNLIDDLQSKAAADLAAQLVQVTQQINVAVSNLLDTINEQIQLLNNEMIALGTRITTVNTDLLALISALNTSIGSVRDSVTQLTNTTTVNLSTKVDKVSGMGLSQNSYTNAEKDKLSRL